MSIFGLAGIWRKANDSTTAMTKFTDREMDYLCGLLPRVNRFDVADVRYFTGVSCVGVQITLNPYCSSLVTILKGVTKGTRLPEYSLNTPFASDFKTINFGVLQQHAENWFQRLERDADLLDRVRHFRAVITAPSPPERKLG